MKNNSLKFLVVSLGLHALALGTVLAGPIPPTITMQPTSKTVYVGDSAAFTVAATGDAPLSYQWRLNGFDFSGKTSPLLTLANVQFTNAGNYSVVVSNIVGAATSSTAVLTVIPRPPCAPVPAGLVSWWRAENDTTDSWGTNNGTASAKFVTGKVGQAFTSATVIRVTNSASLQFTNALTIEAWVNPSSETGEARRTIVSKFDSPQFTSRSQSSYYLGTTANRSLLFMLSPNGSPLTNVTLISTQALPVNQWSFVAATYDGGAMRLYINDSAVAQTNYSSGVFRGTTDLGIGAIPIETRSYGSFNGLLDEVSVYGRALSAVEILGIYNADLSGKCYGPTNCTPTPPGLISWWPADGSLADAMGTNNIVFFSPTLYATGKVGQAFSFNGTSSRIQVNSSPSLNFGSNANLSIETWIRALPPVPVAGATNPIVPIIGKRTGGTIYLSYSLFLYEGRLAFLIGSAPISPLNSVTFISSEPDLRDNVFHHVAVSLDRSSTNGGKLYVDGQVVLTFDATGRRGTLENTLPLYIGAPPATVFFSNSYFNGLIDEPAIYNRALSAEKILAIRQAGVTGKCKVPPSILVQPVSQRVTTGSNVTFSVVAAGSPALRYQWLIGLTTPPFAAIPGATNSSFTFTIPNFFGSFAVRVTNLFGSVVSSAAVLTTNNVPVALAQAVTLYEDTPTPVTLIGSDRQNDPLTYAIVTPPANGTLSGIAPNLAYLPSTNYNGLDSFTFKVNDGLADSAPATISITVLPVNDPPVAFDQALTVDEDTTTTVFLAANDPDGDALTFAVVTPPAHGTFNAAGYTPNTNYFGPDSFTFKVNDGQLDSGTATVSITVLPVNDAPVAKIEVSPLANFPGVTNLIIISPNNTNAAVVLDGSQSSDVENDPLSYSWMDGTNVIASAVVTTNALEIGSHDITLLINDGQDTGTDSATVEVIAPSEAVGIVIALIDESDLGRKTIQPLIASLKAAASSLDRGDFTAAINQLQAFQSKVRAQVASSDHALAESLINATQVLIEALGTSAPRR